jgi:hypothetical protein
MSFQLQNVAMDDLVLAIKHKKVTMGKARQREGSETEFLKGIIRKLKSENRYLKRCLSQLEKRKHFYEHNEVDDEEPEEVLKKCDTCGKGSLISIDFGVRTITRCSICTFKKVTKNETQRSK